MSVGMEDGWRRNFVWDPLAFEQEKGSSSTSLALYAAPIWAGRMRDFCES